MQGASHDIKTNDTDSIAAPAQVSGRSAGYTRSDIDASRRIKQQQKRQHDIFGPATQQKSGAEDNIINQSGVLKSPNRTGLPDEVKANMEAGFNVDFSNIRIHTNSPDALKVNAMAYTQGHHIHFAPGQFSPGTNQGRQTIGHELAHVVQQQEGRVQPTGTIAGMPVNDNPALEKEADATGVRVSSITQRKKKPQSTQRKLRNNNPGTPKAIQRILTIGSEVITHGSRKVDGLYNEFILPVLEESGFKTYGVKSQLIRYIRDFNKSYRDISDFQAEFFSWLADQTRRTRGQKTTPVLKEFSVLSMSRPAWPEELKESLGYQVGIDNIRHVVRNATLKKALDIEHLNTVAFFNEDMYQVNRYFTQMAFDLGISVFENETVDIILKNIYHTVYLNEANLFSGIGERNQIIGFSADKVASFGEELISMGAKTVDAQKVIDNVKGLVKTACRTTGFSFPNESTNEIFVTLDNIEWCFGLMPVQASVIGPWIVDIGRDFGFDLIDGRVGEDQSGYAQRQEELLQTEIALHNFINSDGKTGNLTDIYEEFLAIKR